MTTRDAHGRRRWWVGLALAVVTALALARIGAGQLAAPATAATPPTHVAPSVRGTVTATAAGSLTVATTAGGTVTVELATSTRYGTRRAPTTASAITVGSAVAVVGTLRGGAVTAARVLLEPTPAAPPTAPAPAPTTTPAPTTDPVPPSTAPVTARCDVSGAAQAGVDAATGNGERAAVAVLDTTTGTYTAAGDADATFSTASVVKVLIATQLLLTGQMSGETEATAREMVTTSDDDDADALYGLVGGDDVVSEVAAHYGITDLGAAPADEGQWGETQVTADGLAHLYAALHADPVVWPWLSAAMAATSRTAADGTDQWFGLPAVAQSWSVKQGWMVGLGPGATYNSTGYVDSDRWVVVLLTEGSADQYGQEMSSVLTHVAAAVLTDGVAPGRAC